MSGVLADEDAMIRSAEALLPLQEMLMPADESSVAEAVRRAFDSAAPLYPIGGGTALGYGAVASRPGCGLSLAGLRRIVDHAARDLTITAEAGVTIAELSGHLAAAGQRLPVDIPQADRATLGGVVASNFCGPRRFQWGTMRDYVIGVRAVDGRGVAFSGGGRVVKNAAGYDLCRLLTGSMGTLGIITQVTLMVKPRPETSAFVVSDAGGFNTAERLLDDLVQTKTLPAAIEMLVGPAWQEEPSLGEADSPAAVRLAVGFEGTGDEVDAMVDQLCGEWRRAGAPSPRAVRGADCERLWSCLTEFPVDLVEGGANGDCPHVEPLVIQIGVLPSSVVSAVQQLLEVDPGCSIQAHAGSGIVRARMSLAADQVGGILRDKLRPRFAAAGGSFVVLSSPSGCRLDRQAVWGSPGSGAGTMRAIKDRFDPKGILNPGRFVF